MKKYDAIILSGGKGTRVSKYTKKKPKCLIDINGKPFLYYQLKYLQKNSIKNIILSTGFKGNFIKNYVKKNIDFLNIKIVSDGKKLLGTGGAIKKSLKFLKDNFFIIYGDSYLNFKLKDLKKKNYHSVMAIYKNKNKYDISNVQKKKLDFIVYNKEKKGKFEYIDYGVSYVNKKIFKQIRKTKFDLSILLEKVSKNNQLKGHVIKKRFYEIGSYNGIKQFKRFTKNAFHK